VPAHPPHAGHRREAEARLVPRNPPAHRETNPRLWSRAVNYFYLKETKASFAIEREEVTPARGERFVAVLARSSTVNPEPCWTRAA